MNITSHNLSGQYSQYGSGLLGTTKSKNINETSQAQETKNTIEMMHLNDAHNSDAAARNDKKGQTIRQKFMSFNDKQHFCLQGQTIM